MLEYNSLVEFQYNLIQYVSIPGGMIQSDGALFSVVDNPHSDVSRLSV